jgi:hypothetical protein
MSAMLAMFSNLQFACKESIYSSKFRGIGLRCPPNIGKTIYMICMLYHQKRLLARCPTNQKNMKPSGIGTRMAYFQTYYYLV